MQKDGFYTESLDKGKRHCIVTRGKTIQTLSNELTISDNQIRGISIVDNGSIQVSILLFINYYIYSIIKPVNFFIYILNSYAI
jgi:hypothetical protein